jgi:integrase
VKRAARVKQGSVVYNRRFGTWNFLWCENGKRRSKVIGNRRQLPTKAAAWRAVEALRDSLATKQQEKPVVLNELTVKNLVARYRAEKMPRRASTKRGYESWLNNYVIPHFGDKELTELQARPVELWLQELSLSPKSKLHIRGMLRVLWEYAMWAGHLATQRNPMELVTVKCASHRVQRPRSLTAEQFQSLLEQFRDDDCIRTMLLLAVSFGLRISEVLGLKWQDVNWLEKNVCIERGVVKQIVDDVKSAHSAKTMVIADELLDVLKRWRQTTQFAAPADWIFASAVKLGRLPLSYTHVWETLSEGAKAAGIGHVSSHTFRHTHRTWLDSVGTPVGVQQKLMRHSDIRTTMNIYGDAATDDMRKAHQKVVSIALPRAN